MDIIFVKVNCVIVLKALVRWFGIIHSGSGQTAYLIETVVFDCLRNAVIRV